MHLKLRTADLYTLKTLNSLKANPQPSNDESAILRQPQIRHFENREYSLGILKNKSLASRDCDRSRGGPFD
jgi:hypothetical protein